MVAAFLERKRETLSLKWISRMERRSVCRVSRVEKSGVLQGHDCTWRVILTLKLCVLYIGFDDE